MCEAKYLRDKQLLRLCTMCKHNDRHCWADGLCDECRKEQPMEAKDAASSAKRG